MNKELLYQLYIVERKSAVTISKELNRTSHKISYWLKKHKIKMRTLAEAQTGMKYSKEVKEKMRKSQSGKKRTKQHCENIRKALKGKSLSARNKRNISLSLGGTGIPHENDQLNSIIRNLFEYHNWRIKVFKHDNFYCQECKYKRQDIEAHHKIPFAKLMKEFLKEYDQFSPIEDKETLVRLAIKYKPFWDITNGQTLCKDCHKLKRVSNER